MADGIPPDASRPYLTKGAVRTWIAVGVVILLCAGVLLPPLFAWQSENQQRTLSLSNMRRIATGCMIYSEDWDYKMPPPKYATGGTGFVSWPQLVRGYVMLDEAFSNPQNPVPAFAPASAASLRDPVDQHVVHTSYALNQRFWGYFSAEAFPLENLEIPEQTVLLVEAGRMARDPAHPKFDPKSARTALDLYGDTTDRVNGLSPYPSTHTGQMGVVAADGHGISLKVLYYSDPDHVHDSRIGRIGADIYNWNGGHPGGSPETPQHE